MLDLQDTAEPSLDFEAQEVSTSIVVRPIRPDDEGDLGAFFRTLSPSSRHRRFLAVVNELPPSLLARFARPDGREEVALVAIATDGRTQPVVGEARFAFDAKCGGCAEFAIAVTDPEQRRGLGERLLRALLRHAAENDIACVYGDVLPDNHAILGLARKLAFRERRSPIDPRLLRVERAISD
ncbi:MAG TPA: GNAT family N-acetyltransferase [Burkholderiaceae bacterium]|nr:GNAT family N-acetyltransferase [Burkholderiaceae bacterium]